MSDIYETIITSPALFKKTKEGYIRPTVSYRGHEMAPSIAYRIKELRPTVEKFNQDRLSLRQAAKKLGYTRQTFRRYLRLWNIRWHSIGNHSRMPLDKTGWREAILAGAEKGWTLQQVGESLDTDLVNIHRYCKRHGIEWKSVRKRHEENR